MRTLPGLRPPAYCIARRRGAGASSEGMLVTPRPDAGALRRGAEFGLMLFSGDGKLLWYDRRPEKVHDLKQVTYQGRELLAFFQKGRRDAFYEFLDERYERVTRLRAAGGLQADEHELQLTGQGTGWLASEVVRRAPRGGRALDYVVQELDVATGEPRFEWSALERIGVGSTYDARPRDGAVWDFFHGNSIDPPTATDPTVIISARNTSALYAIDPRTGRTAWTFGGKRDEFGLHRHPGWVFCTQHDAHRLPDGDLMVFDNGGAHTNGRPRCPLHPARALVFRLDAERKSVRLVRSITSVGLGPGGRGILSKWVGSARLLEGGDVLIDWGHVPRISVVDPGDRENLLLRLPYWSYRAAPAKWTGRPRGRPALVARRSDDGLEAWVSWNGATEIRRWQVLAGPSAAALAPVGDPVPFRDLETHLRVRESHRFVAARALAADGTPLGESAPVAVD
jgi:Arylsulfotransferase (ASST)